MPARATTRRSSTLVLALLIAACSSSDPEAATPTTGRSTSRAPTTTAVTVPEREPSTTTTAFDPASVEGQVEAAYLKSWDVYADAVYDLHLDESALATVYAGDHLVTKRAEIEDRIAERRAALVVVDHSYTIQLTDSRTAVLVDRFRNHQVLIDPETRRPIESDPDSEVADVVTIKMVGSRWKVTRKERLP